MTSSYFYTTPGHLSHSLLTQLPLSVYSVQQIHKRLAHLACLHTLPQRLICQCCGNSRTTNLQSQSLIVSSVFDHRLSSVIVHFRIRKPTIGTSPFSQRLAIPSISISLGFLKSKFHNCRQWQWHIQPVVFCLLAIHWRYGKRYRDKFAWPSPSLL
jgi:hypothetical protein